MNKHLKNNISKTVASSILVGVTAAIILLPHTGAIRATSEYSVHIMLAMLGLSIVFMLLDQRRIMFTGLACTAALALWLKNASNNNLKLPVINEEAKLKVAHVNLSNVDDELDNLTKIIADEEIDLLSFQELTPDWEPAINQAIAAVYPHKYSFVRIDPYGMAVYSKYPFEKSDTIQCKGIPSMCLEVKKNGTLFHIVSTYLAPAFDKTGIETASAQLKRISKKVAEDNDHLIALGEYNMVYWTPEIRDFRSSNNLENSRRDIAQGNLRVPYDHIFYSQDLQCVQFKEIISDTQKYLGILGTYQLKSDDNLSSDLSLH